MALRQVERTGQSTPARAGKSSSAEARFRQMKRHPRNRSERAPARPAAALRRAPAGSPATARTRPATAGDRPHRTGPGYCRRSRRERLNEPVQSATTAR